MITLPQDKQLLEQPPVAGAPQAPGSAEPAAAPTLEPIDLSEDPFGIKSEGSQVAAAGLKGILKHFVKGQVDEVGQAGKRALEIERPADSNIYLKYMEDPDAQALLRLYEKQNDFYKDSPHRKPQRHAAISAKAGTPEAQAQALGLDPQVNWTPTDIAAIQRVNERFSKQMVTLIEKAEAMEAAGEEIPAELLAEYKLLEDALTGSMKKTSEVAAQFGRGLGAIQANKQAAEGQYMEQVVGAIEEAGGRSTVRERMRVHREILDNPDIKDKATWIRKTYDSTVKGLIGLRYNMMLSSMRTHVANIAGAVSTGGWEAIEGAGTVALNNAEYVLRRPLPKRWRMPDTDRVPFSALAVQHAGRVQSAFGALRLAKQIALGRELPPEGGKFFNEIGKRYQPEEVPKSVAGKIGTLPTRLLEAEDTFFRTIYYNGELNREAYIQARREAMETGADMDTLYRQYLDSPPDWMHEAAHDAATKAILTNDPSVYGTVFKYVGRAASELQQAGVLQQIIPFVKTPLNATGFATEKIFGGMATRPIKTVQQVLTGSPAERAEAMSRMTIALGIWTMATELWNRGYINGADSNTPVEYQNTVVINGVQTDLSRLDPVALILGSIATANEVASGKDPTDDAVTLMQGAFLGMADLIMDRSMLAGLSDMMSAIEMQSTQKLQNLMIGTATSYVIPGALRDYREMTDDLRRQLPTERSWKGAGQRFEKLGRNAMPGVSKGLPPALDWKGDNIRHQGHWLVRGTIPIRMYGANDDPESSVLALNRIPARKVHYEVNMPGDVEINTLALDDGEGWAYWKMQKFVGEARKRMVSEAIRSSEFADLASAGEYGEGSIMQAQLKALMTQATHMGKMMFLEWLDGRTQMRTPDNRLINFTVPFFTEDYENLAEMVNQATRREYADVVKNIAELYTVREKGPVRGLPEDARKSLRELGIDIPEPGAEIEPEPLTEPSAPQSRPASTRGAPDF